MKRAILVLMALAGSASVWAADLKISTNLKEGDRLAGIVELSVTVEAAVSLNQVEFYVGDQLRSTDTSTPYSLRLDTVAEKEGPLMVEIAAFASDGSSKRLKMNFVVDNQLGKGAGFHLENARKYLNNSKWDDSILASRVALKADENSVGARIMLGRAYLGKGVLDEAQKWSEDAMLLDENPDTCELVSAVHIERAFKFTASSADKKEILKQVINDFTAAINTKHKANELRIKALGAETDANRMKLVDLYLANNEYGSAIRLLRKDYKELDPDIAIAGRLMYACMRSGRMQEAGKISLNVEKRSARDAVVWSLTSAIYAYNRFFDKSADALKQAILSDSDSPAVMTAAAFSAVRKSDKKAMAGQITQMLSKNITDPEVYYYLSILQYSMGDLIGSRDNFKKAVTQNPLLTDAYIQRGYDALNQALTPAFSSDKEYLLEMALGYMDLARLCKPDSPEALNGSALVLMNMNKDKEALAMAQGAAGAGPEYPWAHFTLAAALNKNRNSSAAVKAVDVAGKLDEPVLSGRGIPTVAEALTYTMRHGRLPLIIAPRG